MKRFKILSILFMAGLLAYLSIALYTATLNLKTSFDLQSKGYLPFLVALMPETADGQDLHPMGDNHDEVFAGEAICIIGGEDNSQYTQVYVKPNASNSEAAQKQWKKTSLLYLAFNFLAAIGIFAVGVLAIKVITGFIQERVFSRIQSTRLYWISAFLVLTNLMYIAMRQTLYLHADRHLHLDGWKAVAPTIDLHAIVTALLLLLMNELLRQAILLKRENDLTI